MKKSTLLLFLTSFMILLSQNVRSEELPERRKGNMGVYSDTLEAIHYTIFIHDINTTLKAIRGYSSATLISHYDNLSEIKLELASLIIDSLFVNGSRRFDYTHGDNLIRIPLGSSLGEGDTVVVTVHYHGKPFVDPSGWGGFHFAGDYAFNLGVGFDAVPHNLGKAWFACIDDFRDRALYDVYATVPKNKKAVSGGVLVGVIPGADSVTNTWHWKTEYTLPTYLISLSTGAYESVSDIYHGTARDIPISFYCQPAVANRVQATFVNLKSILLAYENHFGPYPFERVGYTATSLGAMEHAGNISYPYSGWSGNTQDEWWYGHELSHMWFGDMVTCNSAEDMWLNEGWAVWCESLVRECLYGKESYKANMRSKLKNVLQSTHLKDGGYYALYGIPQTITYGNTVYEKGGQVVHTLRNYLGDSLFFKSIKSYLEHFAWQPASTVDMRDYLGTVSQTDLKPFFDAWVFSPGFPHFSIDSFTCKPGNSGFDVTVAVRQKLKAMPHPANNNRLEIAFLDKNRNRYIDTIVFSGLEGVKIFRVPFEPVAVVADPDEKISDATTDVSKNLFATGETEFEQTFSRVVVDRATDTAWIRITHNWVAPDALKNLQQGLRISDQHYWTVEGCFPEGFIARGKFSYSRSSFESIIQRSTDSLVLMYRRNALYDWQPAGFVKQGNWAAGTLTADTLKQGEYAFAVWDGLFLGSTTPQSKAMMTVFPNPAQGSCTLTFSLTQRGALQVYDTTGRLVSRQKIEAGNRQVTWSRNCREAGTYIFNLTDSRGHLLESVKTFIQ